MYTDNHLNLEGVVRDHNKHVLMITFHERGSISINIPVKLVVLVDLCKYFAFKFPSSDRVIVCRGWCLTSLSLECIPPDNSEFSYYDPKSSFIFKVSGHGVMLFPMLYLIWSVNLVVSIYGRYWCFTLTINRLFNSYNINLHLVNLFFLAIYLFLFYYYTL